MRIYYRMTPDGRHITASAQPAGNELTPVQRKVLCGVFEELCRGMAEERRDYVNLDPPKRIGNHVLIRVGVTDGQCFAEYTEGGVSEH